MEAKKGQETILYDFLSLYLTLVRGGLNLFTKYGDFLFLFVQFIRFGAMLP